MGIKKLNTFLNVYCKETTTKIHFSQLYGKKIAIDIMIYIYKYAAERSIIEGIYLLCSLLKKYNITPIFIFDGKINDKKKLEIQKRRLKREKSQLKYQEIINSDVDLKDPIIKSKLLTLKRNSIKLTNSDINDVKQLIDAYGLTYIVADEEADKLCSELVLSNIAYAAISEDTDLFVYGCPRILRYLNLFNEVCILYDLKTILNKLELNLSTFKKICLLAGCDYTETSINIFKCYNYYIKYKKKNRDKSFIEWINQWKEDHIIEEDILSIYDCDKKEKIKLNNKAIDNNILVEILKKDNFIFC